MLDEDGAVSMRVTFDTKLGEEANGPAPFKSLELCGGTCRTSKELVPHGFEVSVHTQA